MFKPTYYCDGCGIQKKETNHWLALREARDCSQIFTRLEVRAFNDCGPDDVHICGHDCLIKKVSAFASDLNISVENLKAAE